MKELVELSLDEKGRIVIPASVQDRLGLEPGMTLLVEDADNGGIRLRPEEPRPTLVDKQGILVVSAQPVADLANAVRRERDLRVSSLQESACL